MADRLPTCENCLIRNILFPDHFKKGVVNQRAFKDLDPEGISLTETHDRIKGLDDLEDYRTAVSEHLEIRVGAAVFESKLAAESLLVCRPDPHKNHRYGDLHVIGPKPDEMTEDLRREMARLANLSGWSCGPQSKQGE